LTGCLSKTSRGRVEYDATGLGARRGR
jgi:hypothetical protein